MEELNEPFPVDLYTDVEDIGSHSERHRLLIADRSKNP
jgi:hypothetical protein